MTIKTVSDCEMELERKVTELEEMIEVANNNVDELYKLHAPMVDEIMALRVKLAPLEGQPPVEFQFQDTNGKWCHFMNQQHYDNTVADGRWPIRELYLAAGAREVPIGYQLVPMALDFVAVYAAAGVQPVQQLEKTWTSLACDFSFDHQTNMHIPVVHVYFPPSPPSSDNGFNLRDAFAKLLEAAKEKTE